MAQINTITSPNIKIKQEAQQLKKRKPNYSITNPSASLYHKSQNPQFNNTPNPSFEEKSGGASVHAASRRCLRRRPSLLSKLQGSRSSASHLPLRSPANSPLVAIRRCPLREAATTLTGDSRLLPLAHAPVLGESSSREEASPPWLPLSTATQQCSTSSQPPALERRRAGAVAATRLRPRRFSAAASVIAVQGSGSDSCCSAVILRAPSLPGSPSKLSLVFKSLVYILF